MRMNTVLYMRRKGCLAWVVVHLYLRRIPVGFRIVIFLGLLNRSVQYHYNYGIVFVQSITTTSVLQVYQKSVILSIEWQERRITRVPIGGEGMGRRIREMP